MDAGLELRDAYARWRASRLGRITEHLETELVFGLAGSVAGRRVLDVGTGDGTYAIEAAARGAIVTGIDVDREMLAAAHDRAVERGVAVELVRAGIDAIPAADAAFDRVLAVTVLCFVADPPAALREVARVLAPGGRLVIGELARWSPWAVERRIRGWRGDPTWRRARFWTRRELVALVASAGLEVAAVRGAVHYPRVGLLAEVLGPIDPLLGHLRAPCPAFLALCADQPRSG